ncbi:Protein tpx2 [Phlyctochytrium planicorne]|nr:Protein tpx2 [Phlyctochytrium planicorne]
MEDSAFEFNAPRFHDFAAPSNPDKDGNDETADQWFDARIGSPATEGNQQFVFLSAEASVKKDVRKKSSSSRLFDQENKAPLSVKFESLPHLFSSLEINGKKGCKDADSDDKISRGRKGGKAKSGVRPLTIPKEFSFASRPSQRSSSKPPGIQKKRSAMKKPNELTIPKPFRFHGTLKRLHSSVTEPKSPYVPLAVKLKKFDLYTSEDLRQPAGAPQRNSNLNELTKPKSPFLSTKYRLKPFSTVISTEEREAQEVKSIPPFKAKPVQKKIFEIPQLGVPSVEKPALTVPMSPNIRKPLNNLAVVTDDFPKVIKANPIRFTEKPFQPVIEHRLIVPADFKLPGDEISEKKKKQLDEQLKQKQQEEAETRQFKAHPIPALNPSNFPKYEPRPITEPKPFDLETSKRFASTKKAAEDAYSVNFVAQPMPSFEPFVPKKSSKPPTEPEPIKLHSEMRAEERKAFDEALMRKERMIEEMKAMSQKQAEEAEKEEIKRLRQQQTHQAQPIKHYQSVHIRPSDRKLTEPESPMLKEKRERLKFHSTRLRETFASEGPEPEPKVDLVGHPYGGMAG